RQSEALDLFRRPRESILTARSSTARLSRRPATPTVKTRRDQAAINTFIYCLGEAANRFDIVVVLPTAESNRQDGKPAVFPAGTYWLARHAPIELVPTATF
ncbi:MAG: hypothetical protein NT062_29755, partial [Proteobacteria bacterium]|nr:hypothetical protein [Pseudomonadota bacterium]